MWKTQTVKLLFQSFLISNKKQLISTLSSFTIAIFLKQKIPQGVVPVSITKGGNLKTFRVKKIRKEKTNIFSCLLD